jgi:hypothetical protein
MNVKNHIQMMILMHTSKLTLATPWLVGFVNPRAHGKVASQKPSSRQLTSSTYTWRISIPNLFYAPEPAAPTNGHSKTSMNSSDTTPPNIPRSALGNAHMIIALLKPEPLLGKTNG